MLVEVARPRGKVARPRGKVARPRGLVFDRSLWTEVIGSKVR